MSVINLNREKLLEICACAWYCAESLKTWQDANKAEKDEAIRNVEEILRKQLARSRRERVVLSIYQIWNNMPVQYAYKTSVTEIED